MIGYDVFEAATAEESQKKVENEESLTREFRPVSGCRGRLFLLSIPEFAPARRDARCGLPGAAVLSG